MKNQHVNVSERSRAYHDRVKDDWKRRNAERVALPAPRLSATPTDPAEAFVPRGVRTVTNALSKAGWEHILTRAIGPRISARGEVVDAEHATLVVRAKRGPRRLLWEWRFDAAKQEWKFVDAVDVNLCRVISASDAKKVVMEP